MNTPRIKKLLKRMKELHGIMDRAFIKKKKRATMGEMRMIWEIINMWVYDLDEALKETVEDAKVKSKSKLCDGKAKLKRRAK